MPRLNPRTEAAAPRRIESHLLIVERFTKNGTEYQPGDLVPVNRREIREAALERPELFAQQYETTAIDLDWLREVHGQYDAMFGAELRRRRGAKERVQSAEMTAQAEADRESAKLEGRFAKQEREKAERAKKAREKAERESIEAALVIGESGFNYR